MQSIRPDSSPARAFALRLFIAVAVVLLLAVPIPLLAESALSTRPEVAPVMKWADSSRLGRPYAKDPSVIRFGDRYLLYFSLPPFDKKLAPPSGPVSWSIGIAESKDLVQWRKVGELRADGVTEKIGICAPGARVLDGRVHLFYQTYGTGTNDSICHAVSADGLNFKRDASNPVFRPAGAWTCGRAIDAEVWPFGDQLLLYFATRDPLMKTQMVGVASASLKSGFSRGTWKQIADGPVLKPELDWEKLCIEAPTIAQRGSTLYMFYAGGYNNEPQQIGVARSEDGVHWTRLSAKPLFPNGNRGEWNESESGHPGFFADPSGRDYLFYQGNNDKGRTWFLSQVKVAWVGESNAEPVILPH